MDIYINFRYQVQESTSGGLLYNDNFKQTKCRDSNIKHNNKSPYEMFLTSEQPNTTNNYSTMVKITNSKVMALKVNYSRGSNSKRSKSEPIRNPNFKKFGF